MEYTPLQVAKALLMWAHWTSPRKIYETACGKKPDDDWHMYEKTQDINKSFNRWFLHIDIDCQQKVVDAALERYGGKV